MEVEGEVEPLVAEEGEVDSVEEEVEVSVAIVGLLHTKTYHQ